MNQRASAAESSPDFAAGGGDEAGAPEQGASPVDIILLVLMSAWRHPLVMAAIFALGVSAGIAYLAIATPRYRVETTILTQRAQALSPTIRSTVQDDPTRSVSEIVHRRENLLTLIQQTNLYTPESKPHGETRPVLVRFLGRFSGRFAENDPLESLVKLLDRTLAVRTNEATATITISIDWADPAQAYRLVEAATQNFLETRHIQEITTIDEVVSMLKGRAAALRENLDRVTEEAQRQTPRHDGAQGTDAAPVVAAPKSNDEELVRLKAMVDAKERAIQDIEEFRRRQLANLQADLDQKRAAFTDQYPAVIAVQQDIEALSHDSPQIVNLRDEHRKLQEQYQARLAQQKRLASTATAPRPARLAQPANLEQNEAVKDARFQYNQVLERLNAAQLELDAARVAFKYRYSVVWPAEVPERPVWPKKLLILGISFPAALLLAILGAALFELRRGMVLRRWQVERSLGLPVLAELKRR